MALLLFLITRRALLFASSCLRRHSWFPRHPQRRWCCVEHADGLSNKQVVGTLSEADTLEEKVAALRATYASLSELYQESKDGANAPLIPLS